MLDAAGRDVVIIETVGVGQDEVDVVRRRTRSPSSAFPGMGDDIQAIKAGLLEIADLHVVNKADRPDEDRTVNELRNMLSLVPDKDWDPPILETIAHDGTGVPELLDAFDQHLDWLRETGELERARAPLRRRARRRRRAGPAAGGARVAGLRATRSSAPSRTSSTAASIPGPPGAT